jgi:hypothetical protein
MCRFPVDFGSEGAIHLPINVDIQTKGDDHLLLFPL